MTLVISRRKNKTIRIGKDIIVKVLGFRNGEVKLGIEAPPDIPINREEEVEKKK